MTSEQWWVGFGLFGQALFTGRFIVQWVSSERQKKSVIPVAFWYLSISGATVLLSYAVYRQDPVFIIGQSTGFVIYFRNLQLLSRASRRSEEEAEVVTLPMVRTETRSTAEQPSRRAA
ncbi:MAG: lipid-A-disaccharide synthase N-terminal domain-containing protein [Planctomycetaceae bacterium]|nr:lipid-A-disaccharide synthase N-terminal domain-containing protein [Planctomycetaceae bacterium]